MKRLHLILLALTAAVSLPAQTGTGGNNNGGGNSPDSIAVDADFQFMIENLDKPALPLPQQQTVKPNTAGISYEEKSIPAHTDYTPAQPRVAEFPKDTVPKLYNNHLKLGYGRFATPLARLYLNNGRNDDANISFDFSHLSSSRGWVDFSEYRDDQGTLKANYYLREHTLGARVNVYNTGYFSYADTLVESRPDLKDSIRQAYTRVKVDLNLARNFKENTLFYDVGLGFKGMFNRWDDQDLHFSTTPVLGWTINEHFEAGITGNFTFSNSRFYDLDQSRIFLDLTPTATFRYEGLRVTAGFKINSYSDSSGMFAAYPVLRAAYAAVPGKLVLSAAATGEMHYNQYTDLIAQNRWLDRTQDIRPSSETYNLSLGLDGNFAQFFNYSVKAYTKKIMDQVMFYAPYETAYFGLVYDSAFKQSGVELALGFNRAEKIKGGIKADLRSIKTSTEAAWYAIPGTRIDLWGSYNFANKVYLTTEIFIFGPRTMTLDSLGAAVRENAQADVNFNAEYRFSKRVSLFLELNNILNNQYYRWYNYQEKPFDVRGGVTLSF